MKNKQHMILALMASLTVIFSPNIFAQNKEKFTEEIVIPLSNPGQVGTLEVSQIFGGVKVIGYDGQEVIVTAMQRKMNSTKKMKNGLRKIENNSMALAAEESDNYVEVEAQNFGRGKHQSMNLEIQVPKNFNLKLSGVNNGYSVVENVNGEFEISNVNNDITLIGVSGSAVVDTVNGEVKATFNQVTPGSQMVLTSFNGDVDLSLPSDVKADFKLRTTNGDIFTGFDIEFDTSAPVVEKDSGKNSYKVKLEKWVSGAANGGGTEVILKSHSGDLIVRSVD